MTNWNEADRSETYLIGKKDFNSFFVTICRLGNPPRRQEGFKTIEQARSWIRERNKATDSRLSDAGAAQSAHQRSV